MPTYEEILGGALMGDQEDGYAERLEDREANTSPYQDPPFYITAYGLALRAGFRGTLEEWLESLIGPKGEPAELRYDVESQALQWKQSDESEWKTLLTLADLQGDVVAQTLAAAEEATKHAPRISAANHWEIWNVQLGVYEDTGVEATGPEGKQGPIGEAGATGPAFTYDMFTAEQLEGLRGPAGLDGKDGGKGDPGKDGTTPHIGTNGNWWVGDTDTGVKAQGTDGEDGTDGQRGPGIFEITTEPTLSQISSGSGSYTVYTLPLSTVLNEISGTTTIRAGDFLLRGYHLYRVTDVDDTTVEMDEDRVSLRGPQGPQGPEGPQGERGPRGYDGEDGADGVGITSVTQTTTSVADGGTNVVTVTLTNGTKRTLQIKNGSKGPAGEDGTDGISPTVSVSAIAGGHRITITDANGTKTFDVMDGTDGAAGAAGQPGSNGADGDDGVGIASIEQTTTSTADGGNNVFTVTLTNGTKATFTVKNGSKGSTGLTGPAGADGKNGKDGAAGEDGAPGLSIYTYNGDMSVAPAAAEPSVDGSLYYTEYLSMPQGHSIQVGDLVIDVAGHLFRVTNVYADETFGAGFVTIVRGADGTNGKDGAAGKDGVDGKDGQRGPGTLKVTTAPSSYTAAIGSYTPKYRIALATVISQSKKTEVLLGDLIQYSYYQYHVDYLDDTYAYISATRVSLRGASGAAGAAGATAAEVIAAMNKETWTFTLEDGSTVTKEVPLL